MRSCAETMAKLGECMDRLARNGFQERESWLCMKTANAMYHMCLSLRRIGSDCLPERQEEARFYFDQAINAIYSACASYAEAPDDKLLEGVIEGMKALHAYESVKRTLVYCFDEDKMVRR